MCGALEYKSVSYSSGEEDERKYRERILVESVISIFLFGTRKSTTLDPSLIISKRKLYNCLTTKKLKIYPMLKQ